MTASAIVVQGRFADVGTADSEYFVAPEAGYVKEIHVVRDVALSTGVNELTLVTDAGTVAQAMVMLTGGAPGDVDSFELAKDEANNTLVAGAGFQIDTDGLGSGAGSVSLLVVIELY